MGNQIKLLDRIRSSYAALRPSEQKVADYILSDPDRSAKCTISEIADVYRSASQP